VDSLGDRHRHPLDGTRDEAVRVDDPGEARVFPRDELEHAKSWVAHDA
jgi:hypothetical protein